MIKKVVFLSLLLSSLVVSACEMNAPAQGNNSQQSSVKPGNPVSPTITPQKIFVMKGVGINVPQDDFIEMRKAGITIVTTEWGMEEDISEAKAFLNRANAAGLRAVMDGGFSATAWGFTDNDWENLPKGKRPVWKKDRVQNWVKALKDHPAVIAWDICNEYGENLPSGAHARNSEWPQTAITLAQLKQARNDVRAIDPDKPILVRTYEWEPDEPPFGLHRPFEAGIAEIVMLNLYSNYLEKGKLQWPTVIEDAGSRCIEAIKAVDPRAKIWISIPAFEQPGMFKKPTAAELARDIREALKIPDSDAIAFFAWGPTYAEYGKKPWYLPETGSDLWDVIKRSIH